jgi:hypothetical protein
MGKKKRQAVIFGFLDLSVDKLEFVHKQQSGFPTKFKFHLEGGIYCAQ